jgi:hypothetical protein
MTISVWRKNFCSVEAISSNQKCNETCQTDFYLIVSLCI